MTPGPQHFTALVTAAGSTTAISVMKALRGQSEVAVRVVGTDMSPPHLAAGSIFADVFEMVPASDDPAYLEKVLKICERESVNAIFPIVDSEIEVLTGHRSELDALGVSVFAPRADVVALCNDKLAAHAAFVASGIDTPDSWSRSTIKNADHGFPLIVKPARGVSSRGLVVVNDDHELDVAVSNTDDPIIQQIATGAEFTIDIVVDASGDPISIVPRERLETKAGICTKGRTVGDPDLFQLAREVISAVQLSGPSNIQVMKNGSTLKVIEINPRFAATMTLTLAAGVNQPLLLIKDLLGVPIVAEECVAETDVYVARYWEEAAFRPNAPT